MRDETISPVGAKQHETGRACLALVALHHGLAVAVMDDELVALVFGLDPAARREPCSEQQQGKLGCLEGAHREHFRSIGIMLSSMSYWWCLEHKCVEESLGCGRTSRIGPYDTQQQAASALERVGTREKEQEEKDKEIEKKWGPKKGWF